MQLFAQQRLVYTPTLLVSYGGPFGENYFYAKENPYDDRQDAALLAPTVNWRRRRAGVARAAVEARDPGGWFRDEEYAFQGHAEVLEPHRRGRRPREELAATVSWMASDTTGKCGSIASGGMSPMNVLACRHHLRGRRPSAWPTIWAPSNPARWRTWSF